MIAYKTIFDSMMAEVHAANHQWWHDVNGRALERNKAELICLMHSELSECMEGERKSLMDDKLHLGHRPVRELADTVIRILDYAAAYGYDLGGAIAEKLAYNAQRTDHKHSARAEKHGKKF